MKRIALLLAALLIVSCGSEHPAPKSYIIFDTDHFAQIAESAQAGDTAALQFIEQILRDGEEALEGEPYSVIEKTATPPSGDKHDYISIGPYWWPDESKPDGLPYIRRDGYINPERASYTDRVGMGSIMKRVEALGKAYFFTKDDKYATRAAHLIDVFFINPETRMNPNLNFGQFIPGLCEGRGIGIIETAGLIPMLSGVQAASDSPAWESATTEGLRTWCAEYLEWLTTHPYGIDECEAHNNHGTFYDGQCVAIYLYLGERAAAQNHIEKYTLDRLKTQVAPDGAQPHELTRTKSWNYAIMNLRGFVQLAEMARSTEIDLWDYQGDGDQKYIRSMISFIEPYALGTKEWQWEQITPITLDGIEAIMELSSRR